MLVTRVIGNCPGCNATDAFGNVLIARDHVLRGCKVCAYSEEIPLPRLSKKVIYLDQFFFSGAFRKKDSRFVEAAELIKKAAANQLLVAPYSSIHENETFQWRGFDGKTKEDLMKFIKATSRGHEFEPSYSVERDQVIQAFLAFAKGKADEFQVQRKTTLSSDINQWESYFRIEVGSYRGDVELIRKLKAESIDQLVDDAFPSWRNGGSSFQDHVNLELTDAGKFYIKFYLDYVSRIVSGDYSANLDSPIMSMVVQHMLEVLPDGQDLASKISLVKSFFASKHFANIPHHWISARMFAVLREQVKNGAYTKPDEAKRRLSGLFQDVNHISFYGPYVDAIIVDQPMSSIVNDGRLDVSKRYGVRVFSLNNWEALLEWLRSLLEHMTVEHKAALALAYA
jgi:hypothetical protein